MKIIEVKTGDLVPYENNPRVNEHAIDKVANSIREFGFKVPIVIDKNNVIVAGHTRLEAAKMLGLEKVPCIKADDLDDDQIRAFRIADNKTAEFSEWDFDLLREELEEIKGIDMEEFGFLVKDLKTTKKELEKDVEAEADQEIEKIYCPKCGALVGVE